VFECVCVLGGAHLRLSGTSDLKKVCMSVSVSVSLSMSVSVCVHECVWV
jgi:hypothetical protein